MAQYDGAITISTKLDNSQFERSAIRLETAVMKLADTINMFAQQIAGGVNVALNQQGQEIQSVTNNYNTYNEVMKQTVRETQRAHAQMASMGGGIQKLVKQFTSVFRMLKTRIRRRLVSSIFNEISGSFSALVGASPELGNSWNNTKNLFSESIGQLVSAVAPILQQIMPLLERGLTWLNGIIDKISQFTSALSGANTYLKAVKKSSDAVKRSLAGFDTLTILSDNQNNPLMSFETAEIDSKIQKFADNLRMLFDTKNWKELGATLRETIKEWFDLDSAKGLVKKITQFAYDLANALVQAITGFLDDGTMWFNIGQEIVHTIVEAISNLITGEDSKDSLWYNIKEMLGTLIADIILLFGGLAKGIVDEIVGYFENGGTVGKVVAALLKLLVRPLMDIADIVIHVLGKLGVLDADATIKDYHNWVNDAFDNLGYNIDVWTGQVNNRDPNTGVNFGNTSYTPFGYNVQTATALDHMEEIMARIEAGQMLNDQQAQEYAQWLQRIAEKDPNFYVDGVRLSKVVTDEQRRLYFGQLGTVIGVG